MRPPQILLLLGVIWACGACAGQSQTPEQRAFAAATRAPHSATIAALNEVEAHAPFELRARHNPARTASCECPPYEVRYLGSWHRVFMTGSTTTLEEFERIAPAGRAGITEIRVVGTPTGDVQRVRDTAQLFAVFELEAVEAVDRPDATQDAP